MVGGSNGEEGKIEEGSGLAGFNRN